MTATIRSFTNKIIEEVPGCPVPRIDVAIMEAMRKFCEDSRCFYKTIGATGEASDPAFPYVFPFSFDLSFSGEFYTATIDLTDYTDLDGYDPISIELFQMDGADWHIQEFEVDHEFETLDDIVPANTKFYRFSDTDTLEIFPLSSSEEEVGIVVSLSMKPSESSTSVDDVFWNRYRKAITALAAAELQDIPSRAWTNPQRSMINMGRYQHELGRHRASRETRSFFGSSIAQGGYF